MDVDPIDSADNPQWPNQLPVVDGVEPTADTPQEPDFIQDTVDDDDLMMED